MWIEYIELTNIRSYQSAHIPFHRGVNFISGTNGVGKTTIIEAIGCTLFDALPSISNKKDYFLRYGEKKGRILISIILEKEGKQERFFVQRLFGSASTRRIFDETGQLDIDGARDVSDYLKQVFELTEEENLEALFENIIGVRQGMFTAPFLEKPTARKKKFDEILGLEQYREAGMKMKLVADEANKKIEEQQQWIARLEGQLVHMPILEEQRNEMVRDLQQQQQHWESIKEEQNQKQSILDSLEQKKERLTILTQQQQEATMNQQQYDTELHYITKQWNESRQANELCMILQENENEYQDLQKELHEMNMIAERVQTIDREMAQLVNQKQMQAQRIETEKRHIKEKMDELDSALIKNEEKMLMFEEKTVELEKQQDLMDKQWQDLIAQTLITEEEIKVISCVEDVYRVIVTYLKRIQEQKPELEEREARLSEYELFLKNYDMLLAQESDWIASREKQKCLQEEARRLIIDLEQFKKGVCPYTNQKCDTVKELERTTIDRLKILENEQKNHEKNIDERINGEEKLQMMKEKYQQLEKEHAMYQMLLENQKKWIVEGKVQLQEAGKLASQSFQKSCDIKKYLDESNEKIKKTKQQQEILREEITKKRAICEQKQNAIQENLILAKEEKKKIEKMLWQEKQSWTQWEENEKNLVNYEESLEKIQLEKEQYEGWDAKYAQQQQRTKEIEVQHQQYIQCSPLAERFQQDEKQKLAMEQKCKVVSVKKREIEKQYQEQVNKYDEQRHEEIKVEWRIVNDECTRIGVVLEEKKKQKVQLDTQWEQMQLHKKDHDEAQEEYKKLLALRETIVNCRKIYEETSEEMAKLLREQLGQEADRFYHALSEDSIRLYWGDEYEVELQEYDQEIERRRTFHALSGGEQMSAGLAIRMALLKNISPLGIAFFDEPTMHLDSKRRQALAEILPTVLKEFEQVFLVSHDDTFDAMTQNIIAIERGEQGSMIVN